MGKLNSNDLLSNFSHEAISRVIPGLVVLAFYFHTYVVAALKLAQNSSILCTLCIFIAAWLIGAIFEKLFNCLIIPMVKYVLKIKCDCFCSVDDVHANKAIFGFGKLAKIICSYRGDDVPDADDGRKLTYYLKYIAETAMFRAFSVISSVTMLIRPNLSFFTSVEWHWWFGFIAFVVNVYLYWQLKFKSSYQKAPCEQSSCYDI